MSPSPSLLSVPRPSGQGHPGAQLYLSRLYRNGDASIGVRQHAARARHFLDEATRSGDPEALFEVGESAFSGKPLFDDAQASKAAVDLPLALRCFERAAAQGHADAAVSAGSMFYNGYGTTRDYARAFALYEAAAEQGHPAAWENLAAMHALGHGVPENARAAAYIRATVLPAIRQAAEAAARQQQDQERQQQQAEPQTAGGCGTGGCACKSKVAAAGAASADSCGSKATAAADQTGASATSAPNGGCSAPGGCGCRSKTANSA
jgi:TPR repeat protein